MIFLDRSTHLLAVLSLSSLSLSLSVSFLNFDISISLSEQLKACILRQCNILKALLLISVWTWRFNSHGQHYSFNQPDRRTLKYLPVLLDLSCIGFIFRSIQLYSTTFYNKYISIRFMFPKHCAQQRKLWHE